MTDTLLPAPRVVTMETTYEIESFLYAEVELLDAWRLRDWLSLLTDDCRYLVPATDLPHAESPRQQVFIISDDYPQICGRVERLESEWAFVEQPRSRTRRLVTNVRVQETGPDAFTVRANFSVHRFRRGSAHSFVGEYRYRLVRDGEGNLKIRERRATLDAEELRPQGKVSFIL